MNANASEEVKDDRIICGMTTEERSAVIDNVANLSKDCGKDVVLIGSGDEANALAAAIVGYDSKTYSVCYDYDRLVEAMAEFNGWTPMDAIEWIEFNTMRSLDYLDAETTPRIIMKFT